MVETAGSSSLALPVDDLLLARLNGTACIVCGKDTGELLPVDHCYTQGSEPASLLGRAVVACPRHARVPG
jgi:hypothetical protein